MLNKKDRLISGLFCLNFIDGTLRSSRELEKLYQKDHDKIYHYNNSKSNG